MLANEDLAALRSHFTFADHLHLDESPTRDYYKELLRGLTHKHNNLLAVVQGFSSLILMNDVDESTRESVEQMHRSAQSSSVLSERILATGGCSRMTMQELDLNEFMPLMESNLKGICDKEESRYFVSISPSVPPIEADSARFKDMLVELVSNAAEAASEADDGHVAIEILAPGEVTPAEENRIDVFIRNNGAMITDEVMAEAFVPFYTTKGREHFGIGLTTAGVLAGQMKMRLGLSSREGITSAWLSIPVA